MVDLEIALGNISVLGVATLFVEAVSITYFSVLSSIEILINRKDYQSIKDGFLYHWKIFSKVDYRDYLLKRDLSEYNDILNVHLS